jgi:pSer/pThr/pTyr-binding forkhead associated (FHA) protein
MILCLACRHQELEGTFFCSECGSPLDWSNKLSLNKNPEKPGALISSSTGKFNRPTSRKNTRPKPKNFYSLHLVEQNKVFNLENEKEIIVGRGAEGQQILPDINLTPYNAYELGVSRLHVSLKIIDRQLFVSDLDSSNGTFINGFQIHPHKAELLKHRDILKLGKLKIQIIISEYETIH